MDYVKTTKVYSLTLRGMHGARRRDDTDNDDMDPESESENFSDDSRSSDGSESEESSELDEKECDERRLIYSNDATELEKQFVVLKEQLYNERVSEVQEHLSSLHSEKAEVYTDPLSHLKDGYALRVEVAAITRKLRLKIAEIKQEAELLATKQDFESNKFIIECDLDDDFLSQIEKINNDRRKVAITSNLWADRNLRKSPRSVSQDGAKRRKVTTVDGPYIIYRLREEEIMEDWMTIRSAIQTSRHHRKHKISRISSPRHMGQSLVI